MKPISLCNVIYKIFAKVLANKLQCILPVLVMEVQSTFVPGRSITDNILIAFEIVHKIKNIGQRKHKEKGMKLNISKTYDRVLWEYIEAILTSQGFDNK